MRNEIRKMDLSQHMRNVERFFVLKALKQTGNNKAQAARLLGIKRTTLVEKLRKIKKLEGLNSGY